MLPPRRKFVPVPKLQGIIYSITEEKADTQPWLASPKSWIKLKKCLEILLTWHKTQGIIIIPLQTVSPIYIIINSPSKSKHPCQLLKNKLQSSIKYAWLIWLFNFSGIFTKMYTALYWMLNKTFHLSEKKSTRIEELNPIFLAGEFELMPENYQ